jgi:type I restriction enzyme S subunit
MSKIDGLIRDICPKGVVYKHIWEVTAWDKKFNAVDNNKQKKTHKYTYFLASALRNLAVDNGYVKLLPTGSEIYGWTTEELAGKNISEGEIVAIPWGGKATVQYYNGKFVTADNRIATSLDRNYLDNKFLYYFMLSKLRIIQSFYRGSGIQHPSMAKVLDMKIPVPPLKVQKEIVNILDKFTQLEAELLVELDARRKQYEYYRDQLVGKHVFSSTSWVPLSSVTTISTGSKPEVIETKSSGIPYVNAGNEPSGLTNDSNTAGGVITIPSRGQGSAGYVGYQEFDFWCGPLCYRVDSITKNIRNKFLYYYLKNIQNQIVELRKTGSIPAVNKSDLGKVMIPTPPIDQQEEIISTLDNFEKIVNDASIGIPAEIKARHQQYEYYRTKLLTFQELPA